MSSVFHDGELLIQTESGVEQRVQKVGDKLVRDHIIEQHKLFFEKLTYLFVALHDHEGKPWISLIQDKQGFINSPDPETLNVTGNVIAMKELGLQTDSDNPIGLVGLDLSTRRRNRLNGTIKAKKNTFLSIDVEHSFGNCPKYIQLRHLIEDDEALVKSHEDPQKHSKHQTLNELDDQAIQLIKQSDTFFIASAEESGGNLDANHRGGKPGFVRVNNNKELWFNDYPGNNFFQTFGNIEKHACTGLMFIDFDSGDLLLLNGQSRIVKTEQRSANEKSKFLPRRCYFTLDKGLRIKSAINGTWSAVEMSPFLDKDLIKVLES